MKIQVLDCDCILLKPLIEKIKNNIGRYHHGFMVVDDTLYLPYYSALRHRYSLPEDAKTTVIDLRAVTVYDSLAKHFYNVTTLDIDDIIDLHIAMMLDNSFEDLLITADEIAQAKYDLGFADSMEEY